MKVFAETERLILRELLPMDANGMFELDSDPEVHQFLGTKPLNTIDESRKVIDFIRQQYLDNGIGRWAVIEKHTGNFIGWAGLKLVKDEINQHSEYYDLGYRFIKKYWGKGYATEASIATLNYGFDQLQLNQIYAITAIDNHASKKVLEKAGLKFIENFDLDGEPLSWFKITKPEIKL
jgi:RimJ/RimL family protein N-acetyltransferase